MKQETIFDLAAEIKIDLELFLKLVALLPEFKNREFSVITHATREGSVYTMSDFFFPVQKSSAAVTEYDADDMVDLIEEGLDMSIARGHAHSHNTMGVTPSGTDWDNCYERGKVGKYSVSVVINNKMEVYGHITDFERDRIFKDVPIAITNVPVPFNDWQMSKIHECATVSEVKEILAVKEFDYILASYKLEEDALKDLVEVAKLRNKPIVYQLKGKGKGKSDTKGKVNNRVNPIGRFEEGTDFSGYLEGGGKDWDESSYSSGEVLTHIPEDSYTDWEIDEYTKRGYMFDYEIGLYYDVLTGSYVDPLDY